MWNGAAYGTNDLVDRFMAALRSYLPKGMRNEVGPPVQPSGAGTSAWDAVLRWGVGRREAQLWLEVRMSRTSVDLATLPHRPSGGVPVVIAPFLSAHSQEQLRSAGWSYWDATGNVFLAIHDPVVLIREQGALRDPDPEPAPATKLRSLKGRTTSEVMVGLLQNEGRATSVRDFARVHDLPVASVSRVISLLRDENFLEPTGAGPIVVSDRLAAAHRWSEDYSFAKTFKAHRYFSVSGPQGILERVSQSGVRYAVTGSEAAREWFEARDMVSPLPTTETWIYTSDLMALTRAADLVPDERSGSIRVAEGDFFGRELSRVSNGLTYVTPWRAVGDLLSASGRLVSLGEDLAQDLINKGASR